MKMYVTYFSFSVHKLIYFDLKASSGCTPIIVTPLHPPAPHSSMTMKTDIEFQVSYLSVSIVYYVFMNALCLEMRLENAIQTMSTTADTVMGAMNAMSNTVNGVTNSINSVADSLDKLQAAVIQLAHMVGLFHPGIFRQYLTLLNRSPSYLTKVRIGTT